MQLCVASPAWSFGQWLSLLMIVVLTAILLLVISLSKVIMGHDKSREKAKRIYFYRS